MRNVLWTIFLVVALQNVAASSTALASPTAEKATAAAERTTARLETGIVKTAPGFRDSERRSTQDRPEILSKNFATPKPVQIYWFFGGR